MTLEQREMKIEQVRPNVFSLTLTSQELSALTGAARMALDAMRHDSAAPADLVRLLARVLDEYEQALGR